MKMLAVIGTALAVGMLSVPAVQAAPVMSPYCNMPAKKWSTNWGQYYNCYATAPHQRVAARHAQGPAVNPYCNMPAKKWSTNWGQYYHCYGS